MIASGAYFAFHHRSVYDLVTPYGPYLYLPYGISMLLFGARVYTLKALVLLINVLLLVTLVNIYRRHLSTTSALLLSMVTLVASLMAQDYLFQIRGDILIYFAVALSLFSLVVVSPYAAAMLMVAALTLGCGLKVTALLYFLYPLFLFYKRHKLRLTLASLVAAAVLSCLPFAMPTMSLDAFIHCLILMSRQIRSSRELVGNLVTTMIMSIPLLLILYQAWKSDPSSFWDVLKKGSAPLAILAFSIGAVDFVAGKVGAGRHHLVPFFFILAYVGIDLYASIRDKAPERTSPPFVVCCGWACFGLFLVVASVTELINVRSVVDQERSQALDLSADVKEILLSHPGQTIELGVGRGEFDLNSTYSPMYAAPQIVFAGNPYTFEPASEADREIARSPIPAKLVAHVSTCETPVWLIPKGDAPFHTLSIYSAMYPDVYKDHWLFPDLLQSEFEKTYSRSSSSRYFDIYTCRSTS